MRTLNKKQLLSKKYENKFLDTYPLHYEKKDKDGNWETVYEVRGISSTIRENYETPLEIIGEHSL